MLVWRGAGIFAAIIMVVTIFGAHWGAQQAAPGARLIDAGAVGAGGLVGGLVIWFMAKALESGPARVLVDRATSQEVTIKPDAGSLFFIPTKYWAFFSVLAGLAAAYGAYLGVDLSAQ
jgi:hypothetical protein